MASMPPSAERFHRLDAARGLAALLVVLFHWPHMLHAVSGEIPRHGVLPLQKLFSPIYIYGWMAVDFFFILSGFIFFCLYYKKIAAKEIGYKIFSRVRFSRLFPLHLISLLIVIGLQSIYHYNLGKYFIYQNNSLIDVLKNLLFIQAWVPRTPESLNGPTWSVSIEILLYISFFPIAYYKLGKTWVLVLIACAGIILDPLLSPLGRGFAGFYIGGVVYRVYSMLTLKESIRSNIRSILILLVIAWVLYIFMSFNPTYVSTNGVPEIGNGLGRIISKIGIYSFRFGLLPTTVLVLALLDFNYRSKSTSFSALGDLSYSSYLLHFPLQLTFVIYAMLVKIENIYNGYYLSIYMIILICLSLLTFNFFERPMKNLVNNQFTRGSLDRFRFAGNK